MLSADFRPRAAAAHRSRPTKKRETAKVVAIRDLPDEEIQKWGAEFKKIFAA